MRPKLTIASLCSEAARFAAAQSALPEPTLYGVTDGKAVGTYVEHKFRAYLEARYEFAPCNKLSEPILVIGNPPWVTNAHLGSLGSANVPVKANFQNHGGLDALTGKSNFDISEWMLIKLLEALQARRAFVAMLVKTAVARKVLLHAWKTALRVSDASIHSINAASHFNAAVDACLLSFRTDGEPAHQAHVYDDLAAIGHRSVMAYSDSVLLANLDDYLDLKHLAAADPLKWRSGIKHDCSKVMELTRIGDRFINGLGEGVRIEDGLLFPMLKSSDVANGTVTPTRWMIVPQRTVGEDTQILAQSAPRTWAYLSAHRDYLDRRGSTIYRGRPPFSIFGVGEYSFASWKVAISGFYKRLSFTTIGPAHGKPVMLDDTCYFLPCDSADEARAGVCAQFRQGEEVFRVLHILGCETAYYGGPAGQARPSRTFDGAWHACQAVVARNLKAPETPSHSETREQRSPDRA